VELVPFPVEKDPDIHVRAGEPCSPE